MVLRVRKHLTSRFLPSLERLERRNLLAADVLAIPTGGTAAADPTGGSAAVWAIAEGESGETAPDLVAYAKLLADSDAKLYCAPWVAGCVEQRARFGDGGKYLPFVDVTFPDRSARPIVETLGLTQIPTWDFGNGTRVEQLLTVEEVALHSGIEIPQGVQPYISEVADRQVAIGSPWHMPIDVYDPNADYESVVVTSNDETVATVEILTGNRSLVLDTSYGQLVFQLFEGRAPLPAGRVVELAEAGFYDGLLFHRVINNFVIQGGDPLGNGTGGSTLGDFDDQFHLDLQHNASGILSFAKSTDDTNDSQFFVTETETRFLDFNHSVFGVLVEGEHIREEISETVVWPNDRPVFDILIQRATIIEDQQNAVAVVRGLVTGTTTLTIEATDLNGHATTRQVQIEVVEDVANTAPFLNPVSVPPACANDIVRFGLTATDRESDTLTFTAEKAGAVDYELTVDANTGEVTVTPPKDFVGDLWVRVGVSQVEETTTASKEDFQLVRINFHSAHRNLNDQFDVNGDGIVSPIDALIVINTLNQGTSGSLAQVAAGEPWVDVNGDCFLTPVDALLVINRLNAGSGEGEGGANFQAVPAVAAGYFRPQSSPRSTNQGLERDSGRLARVTVESRSGREGDDWQKAVVPLPSVTGGNSVANESEAAELELGALRAEVIDWLLQVGDAAT